MKDNEQVKEALKYQFYKICHDNLKINNFAWCPHCHSSFSFEKPKEDGICPQCGKYVLNIV